MTRDGNEAHYDWIAGPRSVDGRHLIVRHLIAAVIEFDGASQPGIG